MVICDQGMFWQGGQEGPDAEGVKVAGSRDARDRRTPCKGVQFPLVRTEETAGM